jgi:hypothetical protein
MMRIGTKEVDGQLILQVEGRLAGASVPELEHCWQVTRTDQPYGKSRWISRASPASTEPAATSSC